MIDIVAANAIAASAQQTTTFTVEERQPSETRYEIGSVTDERVNVLVTLAKAVRRALQPILALTASLANLHTELADRASELETISPDEERVRENLRALKDTAEGRRLVKQYAVQLARAEERITAVRQERTDLDRRRQQAQRSSRRGSQNCRSARDQLTGLRGLVRWLALRLGTAQRM